ncbi:universal stress protein [halophilic archaeon]|nr:universal stress protein [halophilic archaeon]
MDQLLAVVEPTDAAKELLREAGSIAEALDADLLLVHVTDALEYSSRRKAMESLTSSSVTYTRDEAQEGATQFAHDIGSEVLTGFDVKYDAVGYLGNKAEKILEAAEQQDCNHIFLTGRQRSPAGKALFGDATQKVLLDFDGPVTVITD